MTDLETIYSEIKRLFWQSGNMSYCHHPKITKLLFFIQGYSLANYKKEAFKEDIFIMNKSRTNVCSYNALFIY